MDSVTGCKLFIGGLGRTTPAEVVARRFAPFGTVVDVSLVFDVETGMSLGFGFITFSTNEEASRALREADGVGVDGHPVVLASPGSRRATRRR